MAVDDDNSNSVVVSNSTEDVTITCIRQYHISILGIDPTYFINLYGQNPTSQKIKKNRGGAGVPWVVRISNRVLGVGG